MRLSIFFCCKLGKMFYSDPVSQSVTRFIHYVFVFVKFSSNENTRSTYTDKPETTKCEHCVLRDITET